MGYLGNQDAHATQATIDHVDNLIDEARSYFSGVVLQECEDCGEEIPQQRLEALRDVGCTRCVSCQSIFDRKPRQRVRMLDHVL